MCISFNNRYLCSCNKTVTRSQKYGTQIVCVQLLISGVTSVPLHQQHVLHMFDGFGRQSSRLMHRCLCGLLHTNGVHPGYVNSKCVCPEANASYLPVIFEMIIGNF